MWINTGLLYYATNQIKSQMKADFDISKPNALQSQESPKRRNPCLFLLILSHAKKNLFLYLN